MDPTDLNRATDLNDPQTLLTQVLTARDGLLQQARASESRSAMGGHPYPETFFKTCAALFDNIAKTIKVPDATPDPAPVEEAAKAAAPAKAPGRR